MSSLFLKIFLSFWLAMVLVSATLIASVVTTQSQFRAMRAEEFDGTVMPLMAARAADILDDHGMGALADFLSSLQTTLHWQAYLFDDEGKEILSQPAPPEVDAMAISALQSVGTNIQTSHGTRFAATRTTGSTGTHYVLVIGTNVESVTDVLRAPIRVQIVRAATVLFIAGFVCFWLARYITAPVRHLRTATHRLARGNLSARVGASAGNRSDELAELSRDFDHMAEQLESLISSQQRLFADISHELRSPLARLTVALGLVRLHANAESTSGLDRIETEAERLNTLIGSLLRLARLEGGSEPLGGEPVQFHNLVAEVAADADFEAQSRNRNVRLTRNEPCTVSGNNELLRSAVENVIRNAVKYTAEGTEVQITLQKMSGNGNNTALLRVRDHGRGVPENSLANIFLPFYRVEDARDRTSGGSGLGLSITDRAIRLHGGSLRAANCPDGGLLIELRLPCTEKAKDEAQKALSN
ncbi:MAG: HAMP domain-containing protein [Acidobacteria bacterium]|nr:HAMP domain-containing protein [Acidobacteriota bacterium]MBS1865549.1 HAMP domain-containing protein [Acidobacteriota bacterium]